MKSRFLGGQCARILLQDTQEYRAICLSLVQCGRSFGAFEDDLLDTFCGSVRRCWSIIHPVVRGIPILELKAEELLNMFRHVPTI